ncbi:ATP-binding cassette domain-containing protein [Victivallaceae bacterium BBE-744-WT-12]|uniref:Probable ATP-binding protein YbiT n=1 Tax=Victivallis lenta TaxID=2606640 RepID=A0A844G5G8_9BACT|nr:ATP-binding cassette domain-containing protein [Victivallis lenta]AVM44879.1 ABC-F family ATPase [Victivallales bacterium CCUG 44730]MBS1454638.1 ATP-binding cassette domain-containing protein [Lentisphaeria bacterium]MBS5530068.1 ATP-binding cassette domain-containing protein [bacterium]MST98393.1 ATP-binding cassette domain-containing protein [Victivallis lenta]HBP07844.1 ABC-F family ATPase [Lentisphaeria bacterium]
MIAASDISMRFGQQTLFENVSVKFTPGSRYGLIGANGSGKSTFMKILSGQQQPTTGTVSIDKDCRMGFLKQNHYDYEDVPILDVVYMGNEELWKIHQEREYLYSKVDLTPEEEDRANDIEGLFADAGGYTMEADAAKLLVGLGIPEEKHTQPLSSLTGGFKLRVLLAQVLFYNPDILLLDEPTNHLDMSSIDWLCNLLKNHKGTVIVISHNRYFLNEVCTNIADLDYQEIRLFTGNYDDFMTANEIALEKMRRENARKESRISELKEFINRFGANASKARQATSRQKELDKIQLEEIKPSSRVSPFIRFTPQTRLGEKVIEGVELAKSYDVKLFENFSPVIGNAEKIAIIGTNGVGKTTLLKILLKLIEPCAGNVIHGDTVELSYFPQDASDILCMEDRAIDWLARFAPREGLTEQELRSFMGKMLFSGDEVNKPVKVLSGGEKARLVIAKMMLEAGNVLALDEPTNHLDLESIEALNYALSLYRNTIIFVSHDREFISSLATRIIEIADGKITDFPGTLAEFEDFKKRRARASR